MVVPLSRVIGRRRWLGLCLEHCKLLPLAFDNCSQGLVTVALLCDRCGQAAEHVSDLGQVILEALAFCTGGI